jgi:alpha-L-rhamnosidase
MAECAWSIEAGKIDVQVVVPPNTTAEVSIPGSGTAPTEVGSGAHRWSYPYQVQEVVRVPLTIDNTLGEIIDVPEAWAVTLGAIRANMPEFTGGELSPKGSANMAVRQVFLHHPNRSKLLESIAGALAGLACTSEQ